VGAMRAFPGDADNLTLLVYPGRAPARLVDVVLSYCHNCLNDRTLLPLLPYFKSKGVGVISASFSSMGMFTKQARPRSLGCWAWDRACSRLVHGHVHGVGAPARPENRRARQQCYKYERVGGRHCRGRQSVRPEESWKCGL